MNDELAVRVVHGIANLDEELEPFPNVQTIGVAVLIKRLAFDELHDEVGPIVRGCAAAEQVRDVRVFEGGQDLSLVAKAFEDKVCIHAALDELDGDALAKFPIGPHGPVNRPHAAAPDFALDFVGPDSLPEQRVIFVVRVKWAKFQAAALIDGRFEKAARRFVLLEHRCDFALQLGVARATAFHILRTLVRRKVKRRLKNFFNLLPAFP